MGGLVFKPPVRVIPGGAKRREGDLDVTPIKRVQP
jgi:hypothetical protein